MLTLSGERQYMRYHPLSDPLLSFVRLVDCLPLYPLADLLLSFVRPAFALPTIHTLILFCRANRRLIL